MTEIPLACSYNPLYPLKSNQPVAQTIIELVEMDIYQFMIIVFGKTETFVYLQNRYEKGEYSLRVFLRFVLAMLSLLMLIDLLHPYGQQLMRLLGSFFNGDNPNHEDQDDSEE